MSIAKDTDKLTIIPRVAPMLDVRVAAKCTAEEFVPDSFERSAMKCWYSLGTYSA